MPAFPFHGVVVANSVMSALSESETASESLSAQLSESVSTTVCTRSSNAAIVSPGWSPDGKRLVFATILDPNRSNRKASSNSHGEQDIWTVDNDGNDRRRITDGNGINLSPFWANDNRVYFISNRSGNDSVWSVRAGSSNTFTAQAPKTDKSSETVGSVDTKEADK